MRAVPQVGDPPHVEPVQGPEDDHALEAIVELGGLVHCHLDHRQGRYVGQGPLVRRPVDALAEVGGQDLGGGGGLDVSGGLFVITGGLLFLSLVLGGGAVGGVLSGESVKSLG